MFVPAHKVDGMLILGITSGSPNMYVDPTTAAELVRLLGTDNHTYLKLSNGPQAIEVVKATGISGNAVSIERGADSTLAMPFPTTTRVQFVFTAEAATDLVNQMPVIELFSSSPLINITEHNPNQYEINYEPKSYYSPNSTVNVHEGEYEVEMQVNASALGCCGNDQYGY